MIELSGDEPHGNPVDIVERIAVANEWAFQRQNEDELAAELIGSWCHYRLWFSWFPDLGLLQLSCALDVKVPPKKLPAIYQLSAMSNEKLWLGHFDVHSEEHMVMYRHALMLRGGQGINAEMIEELVTIATTECERFYPAFQFVIWGGKTPTEALTMALLETAGEA